MAERRGGEGAAKAPEAGNNKPETKDNQNSGEVKAEAKQSVDIFANDEEVMKARKELEISKLKYEQEKLEAERAKLKKEQEPVETNPKQVADEVAKATVAEAHGHAKEIAHAVAPKADKATENKIIESIHKDLDKPGVFKRVGNFFKENSAAIAGGFTAGGIKAAARVGAGILISPTWWAAMGVGAGAGALVEAGREYWKQSKKLESVDAVLVEMENEKDLIKKAAILNRLEKLHHEARIQNDQATFEQMSDLVKDAKVNLMAEMGRKHREIPEEKLQQLNYLLNLSNKARKETPKTLRKDTEKMLKALEKGWGYERKFGVKDKNWKKIGKAALRGGVVGGTAGLISYGIVEHALPYASDMVSNYMHGAMETKVNTISSSVEGHLPDTVPMRDTVWDTVKQILHEKGVETSNATVNEATRLVTAANDIAIHADHLGGVHSVVDIHMQEGFPLKLAGTGLEEFIKAHGGNLGTEVVSKSVEAATEAKMAAAEHGSQALWEYMATNAALSVAEEAALRKRKGYVEKEAMVDNTKKARHEVAGRMKEMTEADGAEYLAKLDKELKDLSNRNVDVNIIDLKLSKEELADPETQKQINDVIDLLKDPEMMKKLGGVDISLTRGGSVVRLPDSSAADIQIIIPIDQDINLTKQQLEILLVPKTLEQLSKMYTESDAIQDMEFEGMDDDDAEYVGDILAGIHPAILKKLQKVKFGTDFSLKVENQLDPVLTIPKTGLSKETLLALIEDSAEAQGVKFERKSEKMDASIFKKSFGNLSEKFKQLRRQGDNDEQYAKLIAIIATQPRRPFPLDAIHAEEGLEKVVFDPEGKQIYVPPTLKYMFLLQEQLDESSVLMRRVEQSNYSPTDNDRVSLRIHDEKINNLLDLSKESFKTEKETIGADVEVAKTIFTSKIEALRNDQISVKELDMEDMKSRPLREQKNFYVKMNIFIQRLNEPSNSAVKDSLKKKTLKINTEAAQKEKAILSADKKTVSIRPDLSIDDMIAALSSPEKESKESAVEKRARLGYETERSSLENAGVMVKDSVLLEQIKSMSSADKTKMYRQMMDLYALIRANPNVLNALKTKALNIDNVPKGNDRIKVDAKDVHVSIVNNLGAREAMNALNAQFPAAPARPPGGAGGRGGGRGGRGGRGGGGGRRTP